MLLPDRCPRCDCPLPPGVSPAHCPHCLLQLGIGDPSGEQTPFSPTLDSPRRSGPFVPPEISTLSAMFPHLEILSLLGQGGMGAVYKARQLGLDRLVALKVLPSGAGNELTFDDRFTREARTLARLNHPHVVTVHDFGRTEGLCWILMEYVDGINLRQAIRAGNLTPHETLAVIGQICEALQYAHDGGVVHRDIKPENILLDTKGRVKIADFGLAKLLGNDTGDAALTGTHQVMGTLRYMAPEQMEGSGKVDHRADIYSLGVVFYEMLTGELPIGRFASPSTKAAVDARLDDVVFRALEREPQNRYQQASEVKSSMEAINRQPAAQSNVTGWSMSSLFANGNTAAIKGDTFSHRSPHRPQIVPVFATINLLGSVLLMMLATAENNPGPLGSQTFWRVWSQADSLLSFLLAVGLFTASIGIYLWQPWARRLLVGASVVGLASLVIDMPYLTRALLPDLVAEFQGSVPIDPQLAEDQEFMTGVYVTGLTLAFTVVWLLWFIGQLIVFTRPQVIAAFGGVTSGKDGGSVARAVPSDNAASSVVPNHGYTSWQLATFKWLALSSYVICLLMFFSFRSGVTFDTGPSYSHQRFWFQAGQPTPWLDLSVGHLGEKTEFHLLSGAVAIAFLGILSLAGYRNVRWLQTGRTVTLAWHVALWIFLLTTITLYGFVTIF